MTRVVVPQSDIFVPIGDHTNKLRYRILSGSRNQVSAWSVINFVEQVNLYVAPPAEGSLPPGGNPGDTVVKVGTTDYDAGWVPIASLLPDDIIYSDSPFLIPSGGNIDDVLTRYGTGDGEWDWEPPTGGSGVGAADPQDGNLIVGLSMYL